MCINTCTSGKDIELLDEWISIKEISFYFHMQANKFYTYANDNKKINYDFSFKIQGIITQLRSVCNV